ncbi:MAG: BACON domain-containing protein [Bacteroidaceae bacterium]|nr:BACON domain-containing protein [Bacteroidaceae bacterium]
MFALHCSVFTQEASAQEAFYIYQNDGHFDGFFYDQVLRMGVSRLDTLGIEHDGWVSQEIETADSTYRIMLTAIDSVSFVQPEIQLNPQLREMDDLGLNDYFDHLDEQSGAVRLYFRGDMPAGLIPVAGNVLMGLDEEVYGHDGYFGKVSAVSEEGGYIICDMAPIDSWGDLFRQFITVEQVGYDHRGNMMRRMAGVSDSYLSRRRAGADDQGNFDVTLFSWGGRLQYDDKGSLGSNVNVGIDMNIESKLNITYNASSSRFYMKATVTENLSASPSLHMNWTAEGKEWNFPTPLALPAIKFPAAVPIFETDPWPEGFVKIGGSMDLGIKFPTMQLPMAQTLIIDTESPNLIAMKWGNGSNEGEGKVLADKWFDTGTTDINLVLNGFIHAGTKVKFEVATNRWIENLFFASIGWEIYSGPKLEAEISLSAEGLRKNGAYGLLKDSRVGLTMLSIDTEAKAQIYVSGYDKKEKTFWSDNMKFGASDWFLFPDFDDTEIDFDEKTSALTATVSPQRQTCWLVDVGIGIYDAKGNSVLQAFKGEDYGLSNTYNEFSHQFDVKDLPSGTYKVMPIIKTCDIVLTVNEKAEEIEIDNDKLTVEQQKFEVGPEASTVTTVLQTTATTIRLVSNADWLHASQEGTSLKLTADELPAGQATRAGIITVRGTFTNGSTKEVNIQVLQSAFPGEPIITLMPREMTFGAAGGMQTAQIATNVDELTCNTGSATWLTAEIAGDELRVTATPALTAGDRTGYVSVGGTGKNGVMTADYITVTQQGALALTAYSLTYSADGGTQQVTVTTSGDYPVAAVADADWLKATLTEGVLDVTADPNYGSGPRESKVRVQATVSGKVVEAVISIKQQAYITLTPSELNVGSDGGIFDIAVESSLSYIDIQAVTPWVGVGLTDGGRRMTVSVEPNDTQDERTGYAHVQGTKNGLVIGVNLIIHQAAGGDNGETVLNIFNDYYTFEAENAFSQMLMYESSSDNVVFMPSTSWIHVEKSDGLFGPDGTYRRAIITVDNYTDDTDISRTGTIEATLGSLTKTITIEQRPKSAMPADLFINGNRTTSRHFEYMDDPTELNIDARNCTNIYASESASWIHASISGTTLTIRVDDNMKQEERTGTVTVTGSNANNSVTATVNVTQDAYGGRTVNVEYDGVTIYIQKDNPGVGWYEGYLPYAGTKHEGVYGTSSISGQTVIDKKHPDPQYTVHFNAIGGKDANQTWNISMDVNQDNKITFGSVSYHYDKTITNYHLPGPDNVFSAPTDLSFTVTDLEPEPYSYYYRLHYNYQYYDGTVWRIHYVPSGGTEDDNKGLLGFQFTDGGYLASEDATAITPWVIDQDACTITIYLHRKGAAGPALPWGHPDAQ